MGYFLTDSRPATAIQCRERTSANSTVTSKTLTPCRQSQALGQRYDNSTLGRWSNRDPIAEEGGMHLYAFVFKSMVCPFGWLRAGRLAITDLKKTHAQCHPREKDVK